MCAGYTVGLAYEEAVNQFLVKHGMQVRWADRRDLTLSVLKTM